MGTANLQASERSTLSHAANVANATDGNKAPTRTYLSTSRQLRPAGRLLRAASLLGLLLLATQGCAHPDASEDDPSLSADEYAQQLAPSADAGVSIVSPDGSVSTAVRPSALTFKVRTAAVGGRYAPRNIGAIWIETSNGKFVKTLERWARIRARYLRTFATSSANDLTDAVSSATLANHKTHEAKWDLTDRTHARVSDGAYRLAIEITDRDSPGALLYVPFTLGASPVQLKPTSTAQFLDMDLKLQ